MIEPAKNISIAKLKKTKKEKKKETERKKNDSLYCKLIHLLKGCVSLLSLLT